MVSNDGGEQPKKSNLTAIVKGYADRIGTLEDAREEAVEDIREVFKEAKLAGLDVPALRKAIRLRRKSTRDELREERDKLDLYLHALGMLPGDLEANDEGKMF